MEEFKKALTEYGNAMFDCGEFDDDEDLTMEQSTAEYNALAKKAKYARHEVLKLFALDGNILRAKKITSNWPRWMREFKLTKHSK